MTTPPTTRPIVQQTTRQPGRQPGQQTTRQPVPLTAPWWWWWPLIILISTAASWALYASGGQGTLRALVTFWFLCLCPGMAVVGLLEIREPIIRWTLAVALSIALDLLLVVTLLYANLWSVTLALALLSIWAMGGALAQLVTGRT